MRKIVTAVFFLIAIWILPVFVFAQAELSSVAQDKPPSIVEKLVSENTPTFIKNSIATTTKIIEDFRLGAVNSIKAKEDKVRQEIEKMKLNANLDPVDMLEEEATINENPLNKPWKSIELFVLELMRGIFENKLLFYGLILIIIIAILRYIFN